MCIYISLNIVACRLFIVLSFIYIKGVYYIYLYIYIILPINVIFSFKVNVYIRYSLLLYGRDNVYFTIRIYAFELPDRLLRELPDRLLRELLIASEGASYSF